MKRLLTAYQQNEDYEEALRYYNRAELIDRKSLDYKKNRVMSQEAWKK